MNCRGIRGATTVDSNTKEAILAATRGLLRDMVAYNDVREEDVAAIFFTTTADLNATFPAEAARETGLSRAPLLCGQEIDVPGSLPMCLRILIMLNTDKGLEDIARVYIKGATVLKANDSGKEGAGS